MYPCEKWRRVVGRGEDQITGPEEQKGPHAVRRRRIPPSEQIRQQIVELLNDAVEGQDDSRGLLIQPGAQLVAHEALEIEARQLARGIKRGSRASQSPQKQYNGEPRGAGPCLLRLVI